MVASLTLPIVGRRIVVTGTVEVLLGLGNVLFDFIAGQYIRISFPDPHFEDARSNGREFSIASSPNEKKHLMIATRISESGFKKNIYEVPLGSLVTVDGPFGIFTLPREPHSVVCIAGGIGITPFLSMATFAAEEQLPNPITLLYANGSAESAAYADALKELEKRNPNFRVQEKIGLLDEPFVLEHAKERLAPDSLCMWYIAGPPGMVQACRHILLHNGVVENKLHIEEFSNYTD